MAVLLILGPVNFVVHYLCFKMTSLTYSELKKVIAVKCIAQFKLQTAGIDTFCARKHGCPANSGARKHGCPVNSVVPVNMAVLLILLILLILSRSNCG
jgi:hypothetical protein